MKLNEIYTDKGIQDFVEHLQQYGEVHNGSYAYVYAPKGKDYVYKAWTHDPAWEAYVDIVSKHRNPHFPVISKIKTIPLHLAYYFLKKRNQIQYIIGIILSSYYF